jgi:hypothetical protein
MHDYYNTKLGSAFFTVKIPADLYITADWANSEELIVVCN